MILSLFFSRGISIHSKNLQREKGLFRQNILEIIGGMEAIKLFSCDDPALNKIKSSQHNVINRSVDAFVANMLPMVLNHLASFLIRVTMFLLIGGLILQDKASIGDLVLLLTIGLLVYTPFNYIILISGNLRRSKGAFLNIKEHLFPECEGGGKDLVGIDDIEFRDVWFRYNRDWVLCGISFNIKRGEWVSIVGRSGVGKSTLVRMISGFIEPDKGDVIIGGIDLRELSRDSLRRHIGVIPQEVYIFSWSLKENILMGMEVEERKLEEVIEKAGLQGVVEKLPDGLDTLLGEGGYILSGGERQRIGIARVLVRSPDVVIFDEATSSLDSYSEGLIRERLREWSKERMVIVIAHRLSTVKGSERILFIESGKVAGEGRHEELLNIPEYKQLIKEQMI